MDDDVRQVGGIRCEACAQPAEIGQSAGVEIGGEQIGEFGLAAALVGERQQIDHQPAGRFLRASVSEQPIEGPAIGVAREELVAVDEIEQRHGFAPQGVDHVAIIDDMGVLAVGCARPRVSVMRGVPPMNRSRRSSYSRTRSRWPMSRDGTV